MDRVEREVRKSIERYKETGKLPKEYDVIYKAPPKEDELNVLENIPGAEPFESEDAGILADHLEEVAEVLTKAQLAVFDLHMVGGLTLSETARVLNTSPAGVSHHVDLIRTKITGIIRRHS